MVPCRHSVQGGPRTLPESAVPRGGGALGVRGGGPSLRRGRGETEAGARGENETGAGGGEAGAGAGVRGYRDADSLVSDFR